MESAGRNRDSKSRKDIQNLGRQTDLGLIVEIISFFQNFFVKSYERV
jgi:hypothetical protein